MKRPNLRRIIQGKDNLVLSPKERLIEVLSVGLVLLIFLAFFLKVVFV